MKTIQKFIYSCASLLLLASTSAQAGDYTCVLFNNDGSYEFFESDSDYSGDYIDDTVIRCFDFSRLGVPEFEVV